MICHVLWRSYHATSEECTAQSQTTIPVPTGRVNSSLVPTLISSFRVWEAEPGYEALLPNGIHIASEAAITVNTVVKWRFFRNHVLQKSLAAIFIDNSVWKLLVWRSFCRSTELVPCLQHRPLMMMLQLSLRVWVPSSTWCSVVGSFLYMLSTHSLSELYSAPLVASRPHPTILRRKG